MLNTKSARMSSTLLVFHTLFLITSTYLISSYLSKEDEQVLLQRKMKAEEEDVDIDTVVSHTASTSRKSEGGTHSGNMGGAATPVGSSGNAHVGDIGAMSEVAMGDAAAIDIDVIWAEENPDDDLPGGWKMSVVMDNEAADYY